jgi:hypothetical protein
MLGGETTNTNFIAFFWTPPGLLPTINSILGEYANLYTNDVAFVLICITNYFNVVVLYSNRVFIG